MKYIKNNHIVTLVCLLASVCSHAVAETQKAPSIEAAFAAAGMLNARESLTCARAEVKYSQHTPRDYKKVVLEGITSSEQGAKSYEDEVSKVQAFWALQGNKTRLNVKTQVSLPEGRYDVTHQLLVDDVIAKTLHQQSGVTKDVSKQIKPQFYARIASPDSVLTGGIWSQWSYMDPRSYLFYSGEPNTSPIHEIIKSSSYLGREIVFGQSCMKFSAGTRIYWVDPAHGFLVRRAIGSILVDGKPFTTFTWQMPRLVQDKGTWFPASVEIKRYTSRRLKSEPTQIIRPMVTRIVISNFSTMCDFPKKIWEMPWPPGAYVNDQLLGKEYVVPESAVSKNGQEDRVADVRPSGVTK